MSPLLYGSSNLSVYFEGGDPVSLSRQKAGRDKAPSVMAGTRAAVDMLHDAMGFPFVVFTELLHPPPPFGVHRSQSFALQISVSGKISIRGLFVKQIQERPRVIGRFLWRFVPDELDPPNYAMKL